ncbi:MAG: helix-turn-helix domain-containing protein [Anaerolineales bacterium]
MSQELLNPRIKLPHAVIVKAPGLLPMLYTVRELAEELSMSERTLRDWLHHGAPHTRNRLGHIWVDGQAFTSWVSSQRKKDPSARLQPGEGYCMICNRAVKIVQPSRRPSVGRLVYIQGFCPHCNGKVSRGARCDSAQ